MDNTPLPPTQGKRGKPLQRFDLELVEKLAARGLSYKQLAIALGMNIKTVKQSKSTVHSILRFKKPSTEVGLKD
jgi:hypothetical protein